MKFEATGMATQRQEQAVTEVCTWDLLVKEAPCCVDDSYSLTLDLKPKGPEDG